MSLRKPTAPSLGSRRIILIFKRTLALFSIGFVLFFRGTSHPPVVWTRGHPDRPSRRKDGTIRKPIPRSQWGTKEYGIFIADHLADLILDAESTLRREGLFPEHLLFIPIADVLSAIPATGQWLHCLQATPFSPILAPPLPFQRTLDDYLVNRDASSNRPPCWRSAQLGFLLPTLNVE